MAIRTWSSAVWRSKVRHRTAIGPRPMPNGGNLLAEQLNAIQIGHDVAWSMVAAPASPDRPLEPFGGPWGFISRFGAGAVLLPRLGIAAGWNDRVGVPPRDGVVAATGVIGPVHCPAGNRSAMSRDGAVTDPTGSSSGNWPSRSGRVGASSLWLPVTSTTRTSSVASSTARWTLRHTRLWASPCLRACHSPSPRTLMPALSTTRGSGPFVVW